MQKPKQTARLEQWAFVQDFGTPYQAPETRKVRLTGIVYDHPKLQDGSRITTSSIKGKSGDKIVTRNTIYELGQVDLEYEVMNGVDVKEKWLDKLEDIDKKEGKAQIQSINVSMDMEKMCDLWSEVMIDQLMEPNGSNKVSYEEARSLISLSLKDIIGAVLAGENLEEVEEKKPVVHYNWSLVKPDIHMGGNHFKSRFEATQQAISTIKERGLWDVEEWEDKEIIIYIDTIVEGSENGSREEVVLRTVNGATIK